MENTQQDQQEQFQQEQDEQDEITEEIYEWDLQKLYDEMLDECYPMVVVCGLEYYPSKVLEDCDPIRYRCGFSDWTSQEGWNEHPTEDNKYVRTVEN